MSQPTPAAPGRIITAIIEAMKAVDAIGKRGKNKDQNFRYRKYDDIITAANGALTQAGIAVFPTVLNVERESNEVTVKSGGRKWRTRTIVRVRFDFTATDGSVRSAEVYGEADDYGDKSLGKAISYAHKIALIQVLNIPVDDMDPDEFSHEDDRVIGRGREPQDDTQRPQRPGRRPTIAPPPRETVTAPGVMEGHRRTVAPYLGDTAAAQAAGGVEGLKAFWATVEADKNAGRLARDDYNELSGLVKAIRADLEGATPAAPPPAPRRSEEDPWADSPTQAEIIAAREIDQRADTTGNPDRG